MSWLVGRCLAYSVWGLYTFGPDTPFLAPHLSLIASRVKYITVDATDISVYQLNVKEIAGFSDSLLTNSVIKAWKGFPPSKPCVLPSPRLPLLGKCVLISEMKCVKPRSPYHWCNYNYFAPCSQCGRIKALSLCYWKVFWKVEQLWIKDTDSLTFHILHRCLYSWVKGSDGKHCTSRKLPFQLM